MQYIFLHRLIVSIISIVNDDAQQAIYGVAVAYSSSVNSATSKVHNKKIWYPY